MAYRDFSLDQAIAEFQLQETFDRLFPDLKPVPPSDALLRFLKVGQAIALPGGNEKARSEFLVAPILMELELYYGDRLAIFSGKNLDVDQGQGLTGECDFLLGRGPARMMVRSPIFTVVEAKRDDVESGLGQCLAQMLGAQQFNQGSNQNQPDSGQPRQTIFGCVTTGEIWQFLRLQDSAFTIDSDRFYIDRLDRILGCLRACLDPVLGDALCEDGAEDINNLG